MKEVFWYIWGVIGLLLNAAIDALIARWLWPETLFVLSYGEWFAVIFVVTWVLMFPASWYYGRLKIDMGLTRVKR